MHPKRTLAAAAPLLALLAPPGPAVADPAPAAEPEPSAPSTDHRLEAGLRLGLVLPGQYSPVNWFRSEAGPSVSGGLEGGLLIIKYLEAGLYLTAHPLLIQ